MKPMHLLWAVLFVGLLAMHLADQRRHESEIAEMRRELGASSAPRAETARSEAPRPAPEPVASIRVGEAPAPAPAVEAQPKPPMEAAEVRDHLEVTFTQQRADGQSDDARRTAEARLTAVLPATAKLQSLECRTSMCRIETVHQSAESYQQFVKGAFLDPKTKIWNAGFFSTQLIDPVDGKLVIISYLARDGEELPPIAELSGPPG